ncbi:MAG: cupin domain-containing protein [Desulfobacteraceae bacterium]|nr:cupin domain-containing protein [Desulfobacteraceae bacterium]MCB9494177.1 cupin domain-containing protein [Desulfobacteraceae bacterium]
MDSDFIIKKLKLVPLEKEGGYYYQTYRSSRIIKKEFLKNDYCNDKVLKTAIYYLLNQDTKSRLHRLKSDEIYHFYSGDPVLMLLIYPDDKLKKIILGNRLEKNEIPQFTVPANTWQGSTLLEGGSYALMGTTMSPGFDFSDYEEPDKIKLLKKFPMEKELITKLTADAD